MALTRTGPILIVKVEKASRDALDLHSKAGKLGLLGLWLCLGTGLTPQP